MKIKYELILQGMTQAAADEIEYNTMGAFQTKTKVSVLCGGYLVLVLVLLRNFPNPGYLTRIKPYNHVMLSKQKHLSTLQYYMAIINGILPY